MQNVKVSFSVGLLSHMKSKMTVQNIKQMLVATFSISFQVRQGPNDLTPKTDLVPREVSVKG